MLPIAEPPSRKKWTVAECEAMERFGLLTRRYELIDGEIIEKMPENPPHILALMLLSQWLVSLFGYLWVRQEKPILLPGETMRPEPDAAVTREPATAYRDRQPGPVDLLLVAEVSDSTLDYDSKTKALLYAKAGIREYWLLDIAGRRLLVHRTPSPTGFLSITIFVETASVETEAKPGLSILVSELLP